MAEFTTLFGMILIFFSVCLFLSMFVVKWCGVVTDPSVSHKNIFKYRSILYKMLYFLRGTEDVRSK
jgi:hypothetical protein